MPVIEYCTFLVLCLNDQLFSNGDNSYKRDRRISKAWQDSEASILNQKGLSGMLPLSGLLSSLACKPWSFCNRAWEGNLSSCVST